MTDLKKEIFNHLAEQKTDKVRASSLADSLSKILENNDLNSSEGIVEAWKKTVSEFIGTEQSTKEKMAIWHAVFKNWDEEKNSLPPVVIPTQEQIAQTNLYKQMQKLGFETEQEHYDWSVTHSREFWKNEFETQHIQAAIKNNFEITEENLVDTSNPKDNRWLKGAKLNIADAILYKAKTDPEALGLIYQKENSDEIRKFTYRQIDEMSNQVANALVEKGLKPGDNIGLYTNNANVETVASYLGIMKMGGNVVCLLASLQPAALDIVNEQIPGGLKFAITQDYTDGNRPLYANFQQSNINVPAVVIEDKKLGSVAKTEGDMAFNDFISGQSKQFESVARDANDPVVTLFSSGSTGAPKGIIWPFEAFVKGAKDARIDTDVRDGDVFGWAAACKPGWMMFSHTVAGALMNGATIAAYEGDVSKPEYVKFMADAHVTNSGVVPDIVDAWKATNAAEGIALPDVRTWASTSKTMNPDTCLYLLALTDFKAGFNNYIGGTEVFGGYMGNSPIKPVALSSYNKISDGTILILHPDSESPELDEIKFLASNKNGYITPPISRQLINQKTYGKTHDETYYPDGLNENGDYERTHGDKVRSYSRNRVDGVVKDPDQFLVRTLGRDMINKGGVKIGNVQLENFIKNQAESLGYDSLIKEIGVIGIRPPEKYNKEDDDTVVYVVLSSNTKIDNETIRSSLQASFRQAIKKYEPKVSKVDDVVLIDALPRAGKVEYGKMKKNYLSEYDNNYNNRPDPKKARSFAEIYKS